MHSAPILRSSQREMRLGILLLVLLLAGSIFGIDLRLPLGIAGGIPYVAPVLVAMWLPGRRFIISMAVLCSALTMMGFLLSPQGASLWAVIPNRLLAILAIWAVALLSLERKHIEQALTESEARTRSLFATTADGILALNGQGRIMSVNPAAEHIFGYTESELVSHPLRVLLGPVESAWFDQDTEAYLQAVSAETKTAHEYVGRRKDGTTFPVELLIVPLSLKEGISYTATVRDISERRHLERQLLRIHEEERQAIGYGLHEELGQSLTGLKLISRQLARRLEDQHPVEAGEIADLADLLHESDALALQLFEALVPVAAKGGLPEALSRLVHMAAQHGVQCSVDQGAPMPLVDHVQAVQLYKIVQELINWSLQSGCVHHIALRTGSTGDDGLLAVRLQSRAQADLAGWSEVVQRIMYRAKLSGIHLRVDPLGASELLVTCSFQG